MISITKTPEDRASQRLPFALSRLALLALGLALMAGMGMTMPAWANDNLPVDAVPLDLPLGPMRNAPSSADEPPLAPPAQTTPIPENAASGSATEGTMQAPEPAILRVLFNDDDATLSDEARTALTDFAEAFKTKGGRVALKGYGGKVGSTSSNARRLSLRRVLAVRELLLAQGISAERLEVRALGGVKDAGPEGRVDIVKSSR